MGKICICCINMCNEVSKEKVVQCVTSVLILRGGWFCRVPSEWIWIWLVTGDLWVSVAENFIFKFRYNQMVLAEAGSIPIPYMCGNGFWCRISPFVLRVIPQRGKMGERCKFWITQSFHLVDDKPAKIPIDSVIVTWRWASK